MGKNINCNCNNCNIAEFRPEDIYLLCAKLNNRFFYTIIVLICEIYFVPLQKQNNITKK